MLKKNIVFIGFMGSGKSDVSRELARFLGRKCVSTDSLIEQQEGMSISALFDKYDEKYFRNIEHKVIDELSKQSELIIDCGGGMVINPRNMECLADNGLIMYLSITAESAYKNVKETKNRPLLNGEDPLTKIKKLLQERVPLYKKYAEYSFISDNKTILELSQEVLKVVENV